MIVRETLWDDPAASALRQARRAELAERYGTADCEPGQEPTACDITVFFVAFSDGGEPVGCGGLRELNPTKGEIKSMFVVPSSRGSGISTNLLETLEHFALDRRWSRLVLETGNQQPDAIRFYQRQGYCRIPNFGCYASSDLSLCFEKILTENDPAAEVDCEGCQ